MIVVTTPTGQIGSQLVTRLLVSEEPVRVIVRDPSRLGPGVRERVEIVQGSHDDPAVLDQALPGAQALLWLVPPDLRASSAKAHYLTFATAGAEAIRRHGVGHVVGVTSAGHGWPKSAGLLSAAEMNVAQDEGLYDADWAAATPTPTGFRAWLEDAVQRTASEPRNTTPTR